VPERLKERGDPWRRMAREAQTLTAARRQLDAALQETTAASAR
jgi:DNA primase